ncbi:Sls1p [Nakaseomyces bracarensis]|uniref:Sls1p n=1 Tax=Nakaseomyces bracarensis TaxID=273131 RepID=UPI0038726C66
MLRVLRCSVIPRVAVRWQSYRLYSEPVAGYTSTRGKKRRPEKQKIVVLKPSDVMQPRQKQNNEQQRNRQYKENESLSILEGVDLGYSNTRTVDPADTEADLLNELDKKGKNLLVFTSSVSEEQAVRSIDSQRPVRAEMSKKRHEQLTNLLKSAYTVTQLRAYCKKVFNHGMVKKTKKTIIQSIINDYWGCKIDENMKEEEDLIIEKTIDISTRDMSLLLLTDNGKILHNLARIGAVLAVAPEANKIIIRASLNVIKYVEISLSRILKNVCSEDIPIYDLVSNHSEHLSSNVDEINQVMDLIQREADVFIEKKTTDPTDNRLYTISSFGKKRIETAKLLLVWIGKYQPQKTTSTIMAPLPINSLKSYNYPYTNMEAFDWLDRTKKWYRLQSPEKKVENAPKCIPADILNVELLQSLYSSLFKTKYPSKIVSVNAEERSVFSITLGSILQTFDKNNTIFQPRIPMIRDYLLNLPNYDEEADGYSMDQYEYFAQLKFCPDLSSVSASQKLPPPLEMWLELDEREVAIKSSLNLIFPMMQNQILLQTPFADNDYKFVVDSVASLIEPTESDNLDWIKLHTGVSEFMEKSTFDFRPNKKLSLYKNLEVDVPLKTENGDKDLMRVKYDFVNANVHRILRLKYLEKYMVQFSEINGGSRGGYFTQVDFIGEEHPSFEEFSEFVKDVMNFTSQTSK